MKKYQIMIIVVAGVLSFTSSFGFNWFQKQKTAAAAVLPPDEAVLRVSSRAAPSRGMDPYSFSDLNGQEAGQDASGLSERQLQHLIYDIREKMRDYSTRERELDEEGERIAIARESLRDDIEQLNMLREKLDVSLAALREKEDRLQQTILEIDAVEQANLQRLAATYERMDATQAARIMLSMAANNQLQDVVKILYYMNERNAGRLLGEIGSTRPDAAGALSLQLKRVREGDK